MDNRISDNKEIITKRKKKKTWKSIVSVLACIVVFCTTYALILPAITMEAKTYCGNKEHVHGDGCYTTELICTLAETATESHEHTDSCYVEEKELICTQQESEGHAHEAACQQIEENLVCGQAESEEHEHTDACYEETITYVCGQEEYVGHTHTDACYQVNKKLVCNLETEDGSSNHEHTEACFQKKLICEEKEHTHTKICYSNKEADVETASDWERTLPKELSGVWAEDVLAVADSQLGYTESTKNYVVDDDGQVRGYSRYGYWYGDSYGHWCAMFVSFCLNYAEVDEALMPYDANCQHWIETLSKEEYQLYHKAGEYDPVPGDLIFFNWDKNEESDHVGFVYEIIEATDTHGVQVKTIEGNASNTVKYRTYDIDDESIMGYGQLPEKPEEKETVVEMKEAKSMPRAAMYATRAADAFAPNVTLSGDWNTDLLTIAESQKGKNDSTGMYGEWYNATFGTTTSDWTAQFITYCLYYAGIPQDGLPYYTKGDMSTWVEQLRASEYYYDVGEKAPVSGDLVITRVPQNQQKLTVGVVKSQEQNGNHVVSIIANDSGHDWDPKVVKESDAWHQAVGFVSMPKGEVTAEIPNVLKAIASYQIGDMPQGAKLVIEYSKEGKHPDRDSLIRQRISAEGTGARAIYYVNAYFTLNGEKIDVPNAKIHIDFNPDLITNAASTGDGKTQEQIWKYYKLSDGEVSAWNVDSVLIEPHWSHEVQEITFKYEDVSSFAICSTQKVYEQRVVDTAFGMITLKGYSSSVSINADVVANLIMDESLTSAWDEKLKDKYETVQNSGYKIKGNYYLELYFTKDGERIEPISGDEIEVEIDFVPALESGTATYADIEEPRWYANKLSTDSAQDIIIGELVENAKFNINSDNKIAGVTLQYEKADVFSFTSMQDAYTAIEEKLVNGDKKVTVTAIGKTTILPEESRMEVEFVENDTIDKALKEKHETIQYKLSNSQLFTIKFFDAQGNEFMPEDGKIIINVTVDPAFSAAFEDGTLTFGSWVMNYISEGNGILEITEPSEEDSVQMSEGDNFELSQVSFLYSANDYFALLAKMENPDYKKEVKVQNYSGLQNAITNAGTEKLIVIVENNFEAQGSIEIPTGKNIVINLNGNTITTRDSSLFVVTGGRLTIEEPEVVREAVEPVDGTLYGNLATFGNNTLTYYVTTSTVTNSTMGATQEALEKHTVFVKGAITGGSVPAIVIESGTVNLNSGALTNYSNRAIVQKSGTLNLKGGYICGNTATTVGAIDGVTGWDNEISGGAIYVTGDSKLNISGTVLAANSTSERGGAIVVESSNNPVVKMTGGVLSGNMSTSTVTNSGHGWHYGGGGISLDGNATMLMSGGYITNNKVCSEGYFDGGGGIFLAGSSRFTLLDGYVTGNCAAGGGGGIRADFMGEAFTNTTIAGGFISSNHAQTAEGGGVSIGWDGRAYVTGGFITNNSTATIQHWGGGGLFVANGGKLYIKNALVTDNTAGGFGGGVAGCSTGRVFLISDRGSAIWGNKAEGTTVTDGSEKAEDKIYGKNNPVFMENGFDDYFCALTSTVEGNMIGGGASNWKGSADEVPVNIGKDQSCTASYVMGLTADPDDVDKATALAIIKSSNGVYINGNDSHTHGGGVLCNGYLVFGQPGEIDFSTGLEVHGTKLLVDGTETEIPLVDDEGNPVTFKFYIVDANTNTIVSTGKNNKDGNISFSARIPFAKAGTFTYYVYEDQDYNSDGFVMDTSKYKITVEVKAEKSYLNNEGEDTIIKIQYVIKHIKVEKNVGNNVWSIVKDYDVSWANEYEYAPVVLPLTDSTTFKNYSLDTTKVAVEKKWEGGAPEDVPEITVGLYRVTKVKGETPSEPELFGGKIKLSEENNWSYIWNDELPLVSKDGNTTYEYSVIEDGLAGYVPSYEVKNETTLDEETGQYLNVTTYVITNTKTEELKYCVDVTKISDEKSPNGQDIPLGNAEFEFSVKDSDEETVLYFLKESDGSYVLCDENTAGATTKLITNSRGKLVLKGLPAGKYVLEEKKAPTGYLIAEEKEFVLGEELEATTVTYKMVDERDASGFELPETGGPGTKVYTAGGILLLMISVLLYIKGKNQKKGGQAFN